MHTITGKQFKNMARGAGLNLGKVAKEANMSPTSASNWYNDKSDICLKNYDKLIKAYEKLKG